MAAATGGQARFGVGLENRCQRPQPEHQNQEYAHATLHMEIILPENRLDCAETENLHPVVRYHRGIA
jgi:hypothetical protein